MNAVVIEHVALNELPATWRAHFPVTSNARVTVRIEEEPVAQATQTDNPLFGMWQDREAVADVAAYARGLRAPRQNLPGPGLGMSDAD